MHQRPFALLCLALFSGVVFTSFSPILPFLIVILLFLFTSLYAVFRRPLFAKFALCLAFMALGSLRLLLNTNAISHHLMQYLDTRIHVTGVSCSNPSVKPLRHHGNQMSLLSFVLKVERVEALALHQSYAEEGYIQIFLTMDNKQKRPIYGQRLKLSGVLELPEEARNPGGFNYRRTLATKGIVATIRVKEWELEAQSGGQGNPFIGAIIGLRARVLAHFANALTPDQNALMTGILFGERNAFSGERLSAFENTGTVHILATAGLHVGIVALFLVTLFRAFRFSRRSGAILSIGVLVAYAIMAEGRPAVIRAVVIASAYLFARVVEREPDWWNALALAGLVLVMMRPLEVFEAGFQLSFATVITLVLWMPLFQRLLARFFKQDPENEEGVSKRILKRLGIFVGEFVSVATVAQLGVLPLIALYFHTFSFSSVPANTIVVPCIAPIMGLGFLSALVSLVNPTLAIPFDRLSGVLLNFVLQQVDWWGGGAGGVFSISTPPALLIGLYYGVLWGIALRLQRRKTNAS